MQTRAMPYFAFDHAKAAIAYYERVFGATNVYRLAPEAAQAKMFGLPADTDLTSMTMHAGFTVLGVQIACADAFQGHQEPSGQVAVMLDINGDDPTSVQAADDFYQRLVDSGEVTIDMPFATQFWGDKMGHITDKYGISWMLSVSSWQKNSATAE